MENQTLFWEIEDFSTSTSFKLMEQGKIIETTKLTKADVEKVVGHKLIVCPATANPHFIVGARVKENERTLIDGRTRLRGRTKYYQLKS